MLVWFFLCPYIEVKPDPADVSAAWADGVHAWVGDPRGSGWLHQESAIFTGRPSAAQHKDAADPKARGACSRGRATLNTKSEICFLKLQAGIHTFVGALLCGVTGAIAGSGALTNIILNKERVQNTVNNYFLYQRKCACLPGMWQFGTRETLKNKNKSKWVKNAEKEIVGILTLSHWNIMFFLRLPPLDPGSFCSAVELAPVVADTPGRCDHRPEPRPRPRASPETAATAASSSSSSSAAAAAGKEAVLDLIVFPRKNTIVFKRNGTCLGICCRYR